MFNIYADYFYGNKISDYGIEHNRVDYGTLAKAFSHVPNDNIINTEVGFWEIVSGEIDHYEERMELQDAYDQLQEEYLQNEMLLDDWHTWDDDLDDPIKSTAANLRLENKEIKERMDEIFDEIRELEEEEWSGHDEVFQWYIVSYNGAEILKEANEIVYYNEELDMYLWGVTHWGTSWDYVLTDIPCNTGEIA